MKSVGSFVGGPVGAGISFLGALKNDKSARAQNKAAQNAYQAAVARNEQIQAMQIQMAKQREAIQMQLIQRGLMDNEQMRDAMFTAQRNMGAMPTFDPATLSRDYANTKSHMMNDFMNMLKVASSSGYAQDLDRLGGAGSMGAENARMQNIVSRFTPELAKLDDAAYNSAIARSQGQMDLFSNSRKNVLGEISSIYGAPMNNNMEMMRSTTPNFPGIDTGQPFTEYSEMSKSAGVTGEQLGSSMNEFIVQLKKKIEEDEKKKQQGAQQ